MDVGREGGHRVVVGNIQRPMLGHLRTQPAGIGNGVGQTLGIPVGQVKLGAVGGEPQCGRAPNAAGRTGDQAPLSCEIPPGCRLPHGRDDT